MAIPMLKIRRPNGRLIFNMEIAIRSSSSSSSSSSSNFIFQQIYK